MEIHVKHKSTQPQSLKKRLGEDIEIIDVTSKGPEPWVRFSPFYPHGGIPVPFSAGHTSMSVEGIWQGLKVFEGHDVDISKFANDRMKGLKRTVRKFGQVRGHRDGVEGERLLTYLHARFLIYLPTYRWLLEHKLERELEELRTLARERKVVLLDYETNQDPQSLARPLSHAGLIKRYLLDDWPVTPDTLL